MNPPVSAAVFAVDGKTQIQALNRTAPILPMLPTTPQRASHDYVRNGTIDLFAALNIATGKVITELRPNHTSEQFIKFLNKINRGAQRPRRARDLGQPANPQDSRCAEMAATTQTFPLPFHADLRVMDEPGGTLVFGSHDQKLQRSSHDSVDQLAADPSMDRRMERESHPFRFNQNRR